MESMNVSDKLLKEFVAYLKNFLGLASLICVVFPLIVGRLNPSLIPPWPQNSSLLVGGLCTLLILSLFFGIRHQPRRCKRLWGGVFLVLVFLGFLGWLASNAVFVVPMHEHFVVKGFCLQQSALNAVEDGRVTNAPVDLLKAFGENSPQLIWTNVALAKMLVFISFALTFVAVTGSLSAFALQDFKSGGDPSRNLGGAEGDVSPVDSILKRGSLIRGISKKKILFRPQNRVSNLRVVFGNQHYNF